MSRTTGCRQGCARLQQALHQDGLSRWQEGREKGRIDKTVPIRISQEEGLDVGEDTGIPVNLNYDVPFKFTG